MLLEVILSVVEREKGSKTSRHVEKYPPFRSPFILELCLSVGNFAVVMSSGLPVAATPL